MFTFAENAPRKSPFAVRSLLLALAVFSCAAPVRGEQAKYPLEPADTSSPRATLKTFVDSCNEVYAVIRKGGLGRGRDRQDLQTVAQRILRCLDVSQEPAYLRSYAGREAAVCLKEVLDRIDLPPVDEIPGLEASGSEAGTDGLAQWRIPHTGILIAMVEEGPRAGEYLFSPDTVSRAKQFYETVKEYPYKPNASEGFYEWFLSEPGPAWLAALVHRLPDWTRNRVYGQAVWQWIGMALVIVASLLVMALAYRAGRWQARVLRQTSLLAYSLTLLFPVAAMLVPLWARDFIANGLAVSGKTVAVVQFSANLVFLVAALVVLVGAGNRIAEILIASPRVQPTGIDAQFIRLGCRVLSLTAAAIVFLEGGRYLGIPLTTLLAGAGVGGLALALAAQDTLKNVFGSMMIVLDKPYRVGERIVAKGYDGIVQEIGLRSTKIRLLTGHMAAIPNEEMARSDIENIGRRPHIRRITDIAIPLDTPQEKAERAVQIVRDLLADHEGMGADFPPRVYLNDFNRDSLNLRMIYWYHPPNYWDFLAFSERVNIEIMRQFEADGIRFALPSTTTFMAQDEDRPLQMEVRSEQTLQDHDAHRE